MRESIELARKNWKGSGDSAVEQVWYGVKEKHGATEFLGYENDQAQGVIKSLLKNHKEVDTLNAGDEGIIVVNQTPFYAESGGQVGDTGQIKFQESIFEVQDTQKKGDHYLHLGFMKSGKLTLKDEVSAEIDSKPAGPDS